MAVSTTIDHLLACDATLRGIARDCRATARPCGRDLPSCRWCHLEMPDLPGVSPMHLPSCPAGQAELALWPGLSGPISRSARMSVWALCPPDAAFTSDRQFSVNLREIGGNDPPARFCAAVEARGLVPWAWRAWAGSAHEALSLARRSIEAWYGPDARAWRFTWEEG
jgi:hypothetical protein